MLEGIQSTALHENTSFDQGVSIPLGEETLRVEIFDVTEIMSWAPSLQIIRTDLCYRVLAARSTLRLRLSIQFHSSSRPNGP